MDIKIYTDKVLSLKSILYRYAFSILCDTTLAREVVQDVLVKVWEQGDKMDKVENLEAWCIRLTRNCAYERFRHHSTKWGELSGIAHLPDGNVNPEKAFQAQDEVMLVREYLKTLPEKQREALYLRDVEGYSYDEVAQTLGEGLNNVKILIYRARKSVKSYIEKMHNYEGGAHVSK